MSSSPTSGTVLTARSLLGILSPLSALHPTLTPAGALSLSQNKPTKQEMCSGHSANRWQSQDLDPSSLEIPAVISPCNPLSLHLSISLGLFVSCMSVCLSSGHLPFLLLGRVLAYIGPPSFAVGTRSAHSHGVGDFRKTARREKGSGPDSALGSAGQLHMSHSAPLSLSCPVCISATVVFILSPSLAAPTLRGDAG